MDTSKDIVRYWQTHPIEWVETFLEVTLWRKQREILEALAQEDRVSVASAHDLGKTFVSSCGVLWFLMCFPQSKVLTTSVSFKAIRTVLWQEIAVQHAKLKGKFTFAGELFQTELRVAPGWLAMGVSSDTPEGFQGHHEEHLLILVDEACGVSRETMDAISTCAASAGNKILLIGNPTNPNTYFGYTHSGKIKNWKRISMSAYDSPNITIGLDGQYRDKTPLPFKKLVSMKWIEEKKAEWGIDSPQYISRVLGRFPESSEDQLISGRYVSAALAKGILLRKVFKEMLAGQAVISSENYRRFFSLESP